MAITVDNPIRVIKPWDPYPFILLNLALSFQAAYASPIIMMSQIGKPDWRTSEITSLCRLLS